VDDDWYYFDVDGSIAKDTTIDGRYIGLDGRRDGYGETPNM
jgi:glucan-binding YG repeat protein